MLIHNYSFEYLLKQKISILFLSVSINNHVSNNHVSLSLCMHNASLFNRTICIYYLYPIQAVFSLLYVVIFSSLERRHFLFASVLCALAQNHMNICSYDCIDISYYM